MGNSSLIFIKAVVVPSLEQKSPVPQHSPHLSACRALLSCSQSLAIPVPGLHRAARAASVLTSSWVPDLRAHGKGIPALHPPLPQSSRRGRLGSKAPAGLKRVSNLVPTVRGCQGKQGAGSLCLGTGTLGAEAGACGL